MSIYGNSVGYPLPDPRKGMDMTGNINMNGQKLSGLSTPVDAGDAATKGYVDTTIKGKRTKHTVILPADGWADNLQTVAVAGVTADESKTDVVASPQTDDENYTAYTENVVRVYDQRDGAIVFKCENAPEIDLTVNVMVLM